MWKMDYDQISRNYWDSVSILCRCCKSMNVCLDMSWYSLAFLINRIRWFWKFYCQMISKLSIYSSSLWVYFRQVKYLINKSTTIFVFPLNLKKKNSLKSLFFFVSWLGQLLTDFRILSRFSSDKLQSFEAIDTPHLDEIRDNSFEFSLWAIQRFF